MLRSVEPTDSKISVLVMMTPVSSDSVRTSDPERIHSQRIEENTKAATSTSKTKGTQKRPDLKKSSPNTVLSTDPDQFIFIHQHENRRNMASYFCEVLHFFRS